MNRNEAIKVIKHNWPESRHQLKEALEFLIPELKESEDERIRKGLICHLKELRDWNDGEYAPIKSSDHYDAWLAWLEKQGEPKQNITDIISDLENYFATTTKEQQEKDWDEIKNWEEKHFDQKSTWKPNDEQIEALKEACDERWEMDGLDPLYTLYEDLRKLK